VLTRRLFETRPGDTGLPGPQRRWALLVLVMGTLMAVFDGGIVNIALPTLAQELDVSESRAVWITNVYQLVSASSLLAFAALSRLLGRHRLYIGGLAVFTVASLACALAPSFAWLVGARVVQGLGAAAMLSIGPSMYRVIFPPRLLGSAIGIGALVVAFGIAFGPSLGGGILYLASWPWLFAINVPIGIAALLLALRALPREAPEAGRFDWPGALLSAGMVSTFVLALDQLGHGGMRLIALVPLVVSLACLAGFIRRQRRAATPLVPLAMFHEARFSYAATISMCAFIAQGAAFVGLPFLFQSVMGRSPLESAMLFTPWPLALMVTGPFAGRLADRFNPAVISSLGLALFLAGMLSLALLGDDTTLGHIIWRVALCGIGYGIFQAPNNRELLGGVPMAYSANASGVMASVRTFGQAVGTALVGLVLALSLGAPESPIGSLTLALWLGVVTVSLALALSLRRIPLARHAR